MPSGEIFAGRNAEEIVAVPTEDFKDARKEDSTAVVPKDESIAARKDVPRGEETVVGQRDEEIFGEMKEEHIAGRIEEITVGQSVVLNVAKDVFAKFAANSVVEIFDAAKIDFSDASGEEIRKEITDEQNAVPSAEPIVGLNVAHTDWQNSVLTDAPSVVPREDHFCKDLFAETV